MSLSRFTANIIYVAYHKIFKCSNGQWYYLDSTTNQWIQDYDAMTLRIKLSTTVWKSFHKEGIRFAQNTKIAGDFNERNQIFMFSIAEKLSDTSFKRSVIEECQELFYQMPAKSTVYSNHKTNDLMAPLVKRMRHNDPDCDIDSDTDSDETTSPNEPEVVVTKLQPETKPQPEPRPETKVQTENKITHKRTLSGGIKSSSTSKNINFTVHPAKIPLLFQTDAISKSTPDLMLKTNKKRKSPEKEFKHINIQLNKQKSLDSPSVQQPSKKKPTNLPYLPLTVFEKSFVNYLECIPVTQQSWQTVGKLLLEINPDLFNIWSNWCDKHGENIIPDLRKNTMLLPVWWFKQSQELKNEDKPESYFRKKKIELQKLAYCSNSKKYDELAVGKEMYKSIQRHIFGQQDPSKTQIAKVIKSTYKTDFVFDSLKNQWHMKNPNGILVNAKSKFEHDLMANLKATLNGMAYRKREWKKEMDESWTVLQVVQRNLLTRPKFVTGVLKKVRKLLSK